MAQWETLEIALPDQVVDLAGVIDSFAQALVAVLNIALAILQVVKAFLIGSIDPLSALVAAIISEIEGFLQDLRQIGVYVSGDLDAQYPFNDMLGGFQGYERRMVGRLVDRTDPSRPDFSSRSAVMAIFLYTSFDTGSVRQFTDLIQKLLAFFGQRSEIKPFTVPVGLRVTYGLEGAPLSGFDQLMSRRLENSGEVPNVANIRWAMAQPPGTPVTTWPQPAPAGFLVEVSTLRDGLLLAYDATALNAEREDDGNLSRSHGLVKHPSGKPFRLFGGIDQIDIEKIASWEDAVSWGGGVKDGAARVYALRDSNSNVPIPLDKLQVEGKHLLQRTFYVPATNGPGNALLAPGQGFAIQIPYEEMPYNATFTLQDDGQVDVQVENEPAQTVYVRITAVSERVDSATAFQWVVTEREINAYSQSQRPVVIGVSDPELSSLDRGDSSAPVVVTFPSAHTRRYLRAVTAALAVLVLSRSDLPAVEDEVLAEYESLRDEIKAAEDAAVVARAELEKRRGQARLFETHAVKQRVIDQTVVVTTKERELAALRARQSRLMPFTQDTARAATGLESLAKYLIPRVLGNNPAGYYKKAITSPSAARTDLLRRCRAAANDIYRQSGALGSLEQLVVQKADPLIGTGAFRWSDYDDVYPDQTILESLDTSLGGCLDAGGVSLNPYSLGVEGDVSMLSMTVERTPGFRLSPEHPEGAADFIIGEGSADGSPVVYARSGALVERIDFIRNVWLDTEVDVYGSAFEVLSIAAAPLTLTRPAGEGAWRAYRLFPQGLPEVEQALDQVLNWMRTVQAGLDSVVDVIRSYIEFVEARILEIQSLINRLNNLIQSISAIQVPQASGLVVVAQGTDGILRDLITAENKPSDSVASYGGGAVILAGGLPAAALELLQAFFSGGGE